MTVMKRTDCFRVFSLLTASLCFFSCGLDTEDFVETPESVHTVNYTNADPTQQYFSFVTTEHYSDSEFVFEGTEVYYKIYSNASSMVRVEQNIDTLSETQQATSLIDSYGYKTLKLSSGDTPTPLITATGHNRHVYIRLTDLISSSNSDYIASICVTSSAISKCDTSAILGYPRRFVNYRYGFNFTQNSDNPRPSSSDNDFSGSSSASTYYVDVYAVAVGRNSSSSTRSYSKVLRLGSLSINPSDFS